MRENEIYLELHLRFIMLILMRTELCANVPHSVSLSFTCDLHLHTCIQGLKCRYILGDQMTHSQIKIVKLFYNFLIMFYFHIYLVCLTEHLLLLHLTV